MKLNDRRDLTVGGNVAQDIPAKPRQNPIHLRSVEERLKAFDQVTARRRPREAEGEKVEIPSGGPPKPHEIERGWRREDLYTRGRPR
ncbi:MAG: hypothetical protein ACLQVG_00375 [Terriglobia bacterium]